jgi:hypothetical protein
VLNLHGLPLEAGQLLSAVGSPQRTSEQQMWDTEVASGLLGQSLSAQPPLSPVPAAWPSVSAYWSYFLQPAFVPKLVGVLFSNMQPQGSNYYLR